MGKLCTLSEHMSTLTERLEADYKTAMKAQDRLRIDTIRMVKAAIQRVAIDKRTDVLSDPDVITVLNQQAKQRRETLEAGQKNGREDIASQASAELKILAGYLPQALSPDALKRFIEDALQEVGPNQGQIMKAVMSKAAGAADGKTVSQLVSERLKKGAA